MKILAFAGSLRAASLNRKLLNVAVESLRDRAEIDLLDLRDVAMPIYDGDIEAESGIPEAAVRFQKRIAAADALVIATPEYNNSVPGGLKNAIDWVSRAKGNPFRGKIVLLMGASPGQFGAVRSLLALRQILNALFAIVIPQQVALPKADHAFDDSGRLKEQSQRGAVDKACAELLRVAAALSPGGGR